MEQPAQQFAWLRRVDAGMRQRLHWKRIALGRDAERAPAPSRNRCTTRHRRGWSPSCRLTASACRAGRGSRPSTADSCAQRLGVSRSKRRRSAALPRRAARRTPWPARSRRQHGRRRWNAIAASHRHRARTAPPVTRCGRTRLSPGYRRLPANRHGGVRARHRPRERRLAVAPDGHAVARRRRPLRRRRSSRASCVVAREWQQRHPLSGPVFGAPTCDRVGRGIRLNLNRLAAERTEPQIPEQVERRRQQRACRAADQHSSPPRRPPHMIPARRPGGRGWDPVPRFERSAPVAQAEGTAMT